jgi:hypothetical protein
LRIQSKWNNKGPKLKIEFSRVSKDGRLTLVIDLENGVEVETYFAKSARNDLGDAIADLRDREGTIRKRIGFVDLVHGTNSITEFADQQDVFETIRNWCHAKKFDSAVWTALPSQFKEQTKLDFSVDNAISYLKNLPKSARKNALEYINNSPETIWTPVRKKIHEVNYNL